jgi:hypothetical protein
VNNSKELYNDLKILILIITIMKSKLLVLIFILLSSTFILNAQIGFGLIGGVNIQNINGKNSDGDKLDNGVLTGFHAGININIPVAPDFYFQPGLLYSVKGSKNNFYSSEGTSPGDFTTTTKLSYIEMPLNLLFRPKLGGGHLLLGFGPYVAYGIGGSENTDLGTVSYERSVKYKSKVTSLVDLVDNAYYRPFDAGANILFGYEMSMGVFLQLNAQLGLLKINPEYSWATDSKAAYHNTGFGFSLGYRF